MQEQTALGRVGEVVVIENGGVRESEQVCRQFPNLPIRYVFRDPPLPPENGARPAYAEVHGDFVAFLCDDDWWTKYHLESALQALDSHPDAVAYSCTFLLTRGENNSYVVYFLHPWLAWFATRGKAQHGLHVFSTIDMLVATLILPPLHYSGTVFSKSAWGKSLHIYDNGNPYDNDRLLAMELAKQGPVLFNGHPGVYVRLHPGQEAERLQKSDEAEKWYNDTTQRLLAYAREAGVDLKKEFAERLEATGNDLTRLCANSFHGSVKLLEKQGFLPPVGEADRELRYQATIAALEKTLKKSEAANRQTIEAIMNSKTFRVGRALARIRNRIFPNRRVKDARTV